jgi:hypothetical protein
MSQDYKSKFEQMRTNEPGREADENYANAGHVRNICFLLADGSSIFLNYAYLVSCAYHPAQGLIILKFTSDTVSINGSGLEPLFDALFNHIPKRVEVMIERYASLTTKSICVSAIQIETKQ